MKLNVLLVEDLPHPVEKVWRALTDPDALRVGLMDSDSRRASGSASFCVAVRSAARAQPSILISTMTIMCRSGRRKSQEARSITTIGRNRVH